MDLVLALFSTMNSLMAPSVFWLLLPLLTSQQEHQDSKDTVSPGFVKGPYPGQASWWHPYQSLSSLIPHPTPFSGCSCTMTCQLLVIIILWGCLRIRSGPVYNLNLMGLHFQVVNLNLLVITLVQMQLPALMKKIVSKDIWTSSSYCKRIYCWWVKCKGTRNIWITFPFKWASSPKWREWMNYLAISSLEMVNIKVFER